MRGERIQDDENGDGDGGGDGGGDGDGDGDGHIWGSESKFGAQICIKVALTSDFQVLEASGVQATKRAPRAPKKPPRGYRGVLKTLPRDSFEVLWELLKSKKLLKPRSSIHSSVRKGTTELGIRLSPG